MGLTATYGNAVTLGYTRPPIVEAVLEFRTNDAIPLAQVDKMRVSLKKRFPNEEEFKNYNVKLDFDSGSASIDAAFVGYKLSDDDRLNVRLVNTQHFTISRLAPYLGWNSFIADGRDELATWKRLALGRRTLSRIGVRFINRVDIPLQSNGLFDLDDYFKLSITVPQPPFGPLRQFSSHVEGGIGEGANLCGVNVNYSSAPSPLVAHSSFLLDIDVFREDGIPSNDDELWELVGLLRDHKNAVFESLITDRTRALFQ